MIYILAVPRGVSCDSLTWSSLRIAPWQPTWQPMWYHQRYCGWSTYPQWHWVASVNVCKHSWTVTNVYSLIMNCYKCVQSHELLQVCTVSSWTVTNVYSLMNCYKCVQSHHELLQIFTVSSWTVASICDLLQTIVIDWWWTVSSFQLLYMVWPWWI